MNDAEFDRPTPAFAGLQILVVEDETLVSFLLEDMLTELGCAAVWHACGVKEALALLSERRPDAAVLDVNVGGEKVYPVAEQMETGKIPFLFATGYGRDGIPAQWRARPVIQKPFRLDGLAQALRMALAPP
jgi:CheY-like chemotaxis protein